MTALENAKHLLPLTELLHRLGLGEHAKKRAKCPFHDDQNSSFSIYSNEKKSWAWKCFAGCGGGDEVDFLAHLEGLNNADACRRYIDLAQARGDISPRVSSPTKKQIERTLGPKTLPEIPAAVHKAWLEGFEHLFAHPVAAAQLAVSRGWSVDFTLYVIESGLISMPLHERQRGVAFPVVAPERRDGKVVTKLIGYHVRIKTSEDDPKSSWRFMPNESQHGQITPALPFVLGAFSSARLLVITEGQWDAITFALAAGWLNQGVDWPSGVCVIGIRGVSGINTFLRYYDPYWPIRAKCLVMADTDKAGANWYNGADSFAQKLARRCVKVSVVLCDPHKDFNDLYRAEKPGAHEISELLTEHGMLLESEVTV